MVLLEKQYNVCALNYCFESSLLQKWETASQIYTHTVMALELGYFKGKLKEDSTAIPLRCNINQESHFYET